MGFESYQPETPKKAPEALDDKWYARFEKIAAFQDYEYLTGDKKFRESQKENFLAGKIENPILDYPELEKLNFSEKENALLELKKDILENEPHDLVRQLYRWRINEKIAELRMLRSSSLGNDKRFSRYAEFIYGKPEKEIYEYTLSQIKKIIDEKISAADPDINSAAKRLNKELFESLMNNETQINPREYGFPKLKSLKEDKGCSTEEIKMAFEDALKNYQLDGWQIIIDTEGRFQNINVRQESKEIRIPEGRKEKETNLKALIEHEVGTHVKRRESGERTRLKLLGLGLDRFIKGEEGVARYQEQKILGANDFAGLDYHLAISLALGMDGKKRNFREVYEVLKDFYFIRSKKQDKKDALEEAKKDAWGDCVRIFRGTTTRTQGACFTRDIVYREGNIGIWNIVKNNPEETRRFSVGKYDPTNPRHIWILEQLGITEADLNSLDKEK